MPKKKGQFAPPPVPSKEMQRFADQVYDDLNRLLRQVEAQANPKKAQGLRVVEDGDDLYIEIKGRDGTKRLGPAT